MSTNISKQKRQDLLNKIKEIRNYIAAAPQDENTGNLLSYLSDLEKDVNSKKYGLVFEEHREDIDDFPDIKNTLFDLAAKERNDIPADIKEYMLNNKSLLDIIRKLKDCPNKDTAVFHVQKLLNEQEVI